MRERMNIRDAALTIAPGFKKVFVPDGPEQPPLSRVLQSLGLSLELPFSMVHLPEMHGHVFIQPPLYGEGALAAPGGDANYG